MKIIKFNVTIVVISVCFSWDLAPLVINIIFFPCHPRCPCHYFFSRKEIKVFDENIPGFSPYNGLQWEPNGSRSK